MRAVSTAVPGSAAKLTRMAGGGDSRRFRVQHDRPEEERDPGDKRGESEEGSAGAVPRHSVRGPPCSLLSFRPLSPQLVSQQPLRTSTDLLSGSEETGLPISRKRLRDSILNIIVAGRESVLSPRLSTLSNRTSQHNRPRTLLDFLPPPPVPLPPRPSPNRSRLARKSHLQELQSLSIPTSPGATRLIPRRSRSSSSTQSGTKAFVSTPPSPKTPGPSFPPPSPPL